MASERVLVVDPELLTRMSTATALRKAGYLVDVAATQDEAVQALNQRVPDLVLSDLSPDRKGLTLLQQVTQSYFGTPFILMAAGEDAHSAVEAMRCGATDVLLKPCGAEVVVSSVLRGLKHGEEQRRNATYRQGLEQQVEARTRLLRQAANDLERSYDITLEALGDALDLKDSETEGHSRRVTGYTIALAKVIEVPKPEMRIMARGAFLHDIGKMAIPDAILLKPGKLDGAEQSIMREHCQSGYNIVRKIPYLKEAAEIVYSHQEHYDGSGYPRKLKQDEIPLGARIFSVADTLDAITSDRPYRKGRSFVAARDEISRCAGTQFDPQVVTAFMGMPPEIWEDLRAGISPPRRSIAEALDSTGTE
ncbi:MAG TPA: HD domain-containing phosphohydrolase [Acidobacteriaceae bacterium]